MDPMMNAFANPMMGGGSPLGGGFAAGYMQGLMMAQMAQAQSRLGGGMPMGGPGMAGMPGLGGMPGVGGMGGDPTQTTLLALATILTSLLMNQSNPNGGAQGGCPNCNPNNSGGGGSAADGGGGGGGGNISTPNADPNTQIPSAGPNANKQQIEQILDAAARKYGIPPDILKAIAWKESRWNPAARGDGGKSYGMMQIYTSAHPNYDAARGQQDIAYNVDYGAKLLRSLYDRHKDWKTAVMRYNGSGPMAQRYADDVMGNIVGSRPWAR